METNGAKLNNNDDVPFIDHKSDLKGLPPSESGSLIEKLAGIIKNTGYTNALNPFIENINASSAMIVIENNEIFSNLQNNHKLILSEIVSQDKNLSEKAFNKIIEEANDELVSSLVKNKKIYKSLARSNKQKIIEKLFVSPWLSQEDAEGMIHLLELNEQREVIPEEKNKLDIFKEKGQRDIAAKLLSAGINMETIFRIFKIKNLSGKAFPDFLKEF